MTPLQLAKARWIAWAVLNSRTMPDADDEAVVRALDNCRRRGDLDEMYRRARIIVAHQREPLRSIRARPS